MVFIRPVCFGLGAVINVFETRDGNTAPSQTPSFYLPCYKRLLVTRNSIEGKCGTTLARRWSKSAAVKFLPKLMVQRFGEPKEDFHLEVVNVNYGLAPDNRQKPSDVRSEPIGDLLFSCSARLQHEKCRRGEKFLDAASKVTRHSSTARQYLGDQFTGRRLYSPFNRPKKVNIRTSFMPQIALTSVNTFTWRQVMLKKLLVQLFGLLLTGGAAFCILFSAALVEIGSSNTGVFDYLAMAGMFIGFFGPLLIFGVHCLFRWRVAKHLDRVFIAIMGACVLISLGVHVYVAMQFTPNSDVMGGYFMLFSISFALSAFGTKVGRF